MQKARPSPVRPYKRFMDIRQENSGRDPSALYAQFAMKSSSIDAYRGDRIGTKARKDDGCLIPNG